MSVIIPTYNRSHMLADAVRSVLEQTFTDLELIVVDDGSTDRTAELLESWAGKLKVIRTPRRGVAAARNRGAKEAKGRFLAFLDSDDLWLPEKLQLQLEAHRQAPEMLISHTDEIWIRRGVRVNPMKKHAKKGGWIFEHCLPFCKISPSAVMIERRFFLSLGGFDESFRVCEDYELWLRITAQHPVLYLDRKLVIKRGGHSDQLSSSGWGFDRYRVKALEKLINQEELTASQQKAALLELSRKAGILARGYRKRNKLHQAQRYGYLEQWASLEAIQPGAGISING